MAGFRLPAAGAYDGCLVADAQLDPRRALLYAAVAREKRLDPEGRRHYWILALHLPDLRRVQSHEVQGLVEGGMRLLLSPGRDELLASYSRFEPDGGEGAWLNATERFSAPALAAIGAREDRRRAADEGSLPSSVALSRFAGWISGGRILDRSWILNESGRPLQRLDPYSLLPAAENGNLQSLAQRGATSQPFLRIAFADSAAQRALYAIGHDGGLATASKGAALWVYDFGSNLPLHPIVTPEAVAAYDPTRRETPTVHLSPDGDSVLLERFEWRQGPGAAAARRFKTGLVDVYDVGTGALARTVTLEPAPGFSSRLLGISPDASLALFGTAERLYIAPLEGGRPVKVIETAASFDPFWSVEVVFP